MTKIVDSRGLEEKEGEGYSNLYVKEKGTYWKDRNNKLILE